jgi:hypothetical protein
MGPRVMIYIQSFMKTGSGIQNLKGGGGGGVNIDTKTKKNAKANIRKAG